MAGGGIDASGSV